MARAIAAVGASACRPGDLMTAGQVVLRDQRDWRPPRRVAGSCPETWCKKDSAGHRLRFGGSARQAATAGRLTLGLSPPGGGCQRHQARVRRPGLGEHDLLPGVGLIEQGREGRLGFLHIDHDGHCTLLWIDLLTKPISQRRRVKWPLRQQAASETAKEKRAPAGARFGFRFRWWRNQKVWRRPAPKALTSWPAFGVAVPVGLFG
jgi:hypothetical protein